MNNQRELAAAEQGIPEGLYVDEAKSLPAATTAEELAAQYSTINGYTDRTPIQKNFLLQKAEKAGLLKEA